MFHKRRRGCPRPLSRCAALLLLTTARGAKFSFEEEMDCTVEGTRCFGCQELNYCNGHGRCRYGMKGGAYCECDAGWGNPDDVAIDRGAFCSQMTCPMGKATVDMPTDSSNNGLCDRLTGKCLCFASWSGDTCQRRNCPNQCSGHGQCMTMMELARRPDALPLNNGLEFTNLNETHPPELLKNHPNASIIRYEGDPGGTTWDMTVGVGCLCDSSWPVGLGPGERQQAEYFGPDCSLRRCPSADDPITAADETDCTNKTAEGGRGRGLAGNICHVDCANRGVCQTQSGLCKCFKGHYGSACEKRTTRGY